MDMKISTLEELTSSNQDPTPRAQVILPIAITRDRVISDLTANRLTLQTIRKYAIPIYNEIIDDIIETFNQKGIPGQFPEHIYRLKDCFKDYLAGHEGAEDYFKSHFGEDTSLRVFYPGDDYYNEVGNRISVFLNFVELLGRESGERYTAYDLETDDRQVVRAFALFPNADFKNVTRQRREIGLPRSFAGDTKYYYAKYGIPFGPLNKFVSDLPAINAAKVGSMQYMR